MNSFLYVVIPYLYATSSGKINGDVNFHFLYKTYNYKIMVVKKSSIHMNFLGSLAIWMTQTQLCFEYKEIDPT